MKAVPHVSYLRKLLRVQPKTSTVRSLRKPVSPWTAHFWASLLRDVYFVNGHCLVLRTDWPGTHLYSPVRPRRAVAWTFPSLVPAAAPLLVRGRPDTVEKLRRDAERTARPRVLGGRPLYGISV